MTELDKKFRQEYCDLSAKYNTECNRIDEEIAKLHEYRIKCRDQYIADLQRLKEEHLAKGGHF